MTDQAHPLDMDFPRPPWLVGVRRGERARVFWAEAGEAVAALVARYPSALGEAGDHWWVEPAIAEQLCATWHWRCALDAGEMGVDPRQEVEFHHWLAILSGRLTALARAELVTDPQAVIASPSGPPAAAALEAALARMPDDPDATPEAAARAPRAGYPPP